MNDSPSPGSNAESHDSSTDSANDLIEPGPNRNRILERLRWPLVTLACVLGAGFLTSLTDVEQVDAGFATPEIEASATDLRALGNLEWPTSGVWRNGELVFADILLNSLVTIDPATQKIVDVEKKYHPQGLLKGSGVLDLSEIRELPDGSGYLLEDEGGPATQAGDKLVRLGADMNTMLGNLQVEGRELVDGWTLDVVYDWQPSLVDGTLGVLAFGDMHRSTDPAYPGARDEWSSGLVYFDDEGGAAVYEHFAVASDTSYQHTQARNYISVVEGTGYMLVFEAVPYVISVDLSPGEKRLQSKSSIAVIELPPALRNRGSVKNTDHWQKANRGPEKLLAHYELTESFSGASAIVAVDGRLHVLERRVARDEVRWRSHGFDLGTNAFVDPIPLDALGNDAWHLNFSVGPSLSGLGVLKKGKIERLRGGPWDVPYFPIEGIVVISADQLG